MTVKQIDVRMVEHVMIYIRDTCVAAQLVMKEQIAKPKVGFYYYI